MPPSKIFPDGSVGKIFIGRFIKGPWLVVLSPKGQDENMNATKDAGKILEECVSCKSLWDLEQVGNHLMCTKCADNLEDIHASLNRLQALAELGVEIPPIRLI